MKKQIQKITFILLLLGSFCFSIRLEAAHIIGGDITYKCIDLDVDLQTTTFEIKVVMYRDSKGGGAGFDGNAAFGLYSGSGNNWTYIRTIRARPSQEDLTFVEDPCVEIPPDVGVQSGTYTFTVSLPWISSTYKIAYQRCCRNNTVTNLVRPDQTGAVFEIDILPEALTSCNNSPVFNSFPPIVLCLNNKFDIDLSGTDADGDQIFYEFCTPKSSGGQDPGTGCTSVIVDPRDCLPPFGTVTFRSPTYTVNNPLGANSTTSLDPNTGILTIQPSQVGQFVIGVCIKEFRNGKLLSSVSRDFQFNIAQCVNLVDAVIDTKAPGANITVNDNLITITSCANKTILFDNNSISNEVNPTYLWRFDSPLGTITSEDKDALISFPDFGPYTGELIVNPQNGKCSDTAFIQLEIFPETTADFDFEYDTCIAGPISFKDLSVTGSEGIVYWHWSLTSQDTTNTQNPIFRYNKPGTKEVALRILDINKCADTITKSIDWLPVPDLIVIEPSEFAGCVPASIFYNNLSNPINERYLIDWDFGDGTRSNQLSPTHVYKEEGIYTIALKITSPEGCITSDTFSNLVEVFPPPVSDFIYSPTSLSNFSSNVDFTNMSEYTEAWNWSVNGSIFSFDESPSFVFNDTGIYNVTLIGYHKYGCTDTITKSIDIVPKSTFYLPNAFTPNNDGLNDSYKPEGIFLGIHDYTLTIFDRWGGKLFTSDDISRGWNGEVNGKAVAAGVYPFTVLYKEARGNFVQQKGLLTLIR